MVLHSGSGDDVEQRNVTRLSLDAEVDADAIFAFVPGPRIPSDESRVASFQRFQLSATASFVGVVDWIDARHDFHTYNSVSTIFVEEGDPVRVETSLDRTNQPHGVVATVLVSGSRTVGVLDRLQAAAGGFLTYPGAGLGILSEVSVSAERQQQGVTVVRIAAAESEDVQRLLAHCLEPLAADLGVAPCEPL